MRLKKFLIYLVISLFTSIGLVHANVSGSEASELAFVTEKEELKQVQEEIAIEQKNIFLKIQREKIKREQKKAQ